MTKYINIELSGNKKGVNHWPERQYLHATTPTTTSSATAFTTATTLPLPLKPCYCSKYYQGCLNEQNIRRNDEGKDELNSQHTMCK